MHIRTLAALTLCLTGCTTHQPYDAGEFRQAPLSLKQIALNEGGLTAEQIRVISATEPPRAFPVDVAVVIVTDGYLPAATQELFTYDLVKGLESSSKIGRVTLIPNFLVPDRIGFGSIQELGVRALSEYVIVFHVDPHEIHRWTQIFKSQYRLDSTISYIIVDSGTSAMLTADRLHSTHDYEDKLFEREEREQAQREIFSEQGRLIAAKLDELFSGR
ncbi:MAG: hypothetical protein H6831_08140 [Planctomycetes bacterium]|nr:hypothetical protein [Planctomycetota bacterium]MCB9904361.1 hypothetical protein [Planctomycetota bacterium]